MRSLFEKKSWVLLLSALALGALTTLAVSVGNVSFGGAQPIGREEAEGPARPPPLSPGPINEVTISSQVALWVVLAVLVALVGVLLSPEARRRMIRILIRTAFTVWALYILLDRYPDVFGFLTPILQGGFSSPQSLEGDAGVPPPVFTPPQESSILSDAVSLLVVLAVAFLGWRAYLAWQALIPRPSTSLQSLARIARASLRDLSSGRETTDVIMNCYFHMSDVVADKRNLHRSMDMTPAEFASRLEEDLLPLVQLRAQGYQVLAVSPDPVKFELSYLNKDRNVELASRVVQLERRLLLQKAQRAGVQVLDWDVSEPFDQVVKRKLSRPPAWMRAVGR